MSPTQIAVKHLIGYRFDHCLISILAYYLKGSQLRFRTAFMHQRNCVVNSTVRRGKSKLVVAGSS